MQRRALRLPALAVAVLALPYLAAVADTAALSADTAAPGVAAPTEAPPEAPPAAEPAPATEAPEADGHVIGHAGAALGLARVLPGSIPEGSIAEQVEDDLATQLATDNGLGLTSARANSAGAAAFERAIAQAAPSGAAAEGNPSVPRPARGTLLQTALEDNPEPLTGDVDQPEPVHPVLSEATELDGSVHARWSEGDGPCVDPIAEAEVSAAGLTAGAGVLTLPDVRIAELDLPFAEGYSPEGTLGDLGGLLPGVEADGGGLIAAADGLSSSSQVSLADAGEQDGQAVQAVSTVAAEALAVFPGTPVALDLEVTTGPELTATSTGSGEDSTVDYQPPTLEGSVDDQALFELDAEETSTDVPIGVPAEGFEDTPGFEEITGLPIVGGVAAGEDGELVVLPEDAGDEVVDLFVLRLAIAGLDEQSEALDRPFAGHHVGGSARLLDVTLLPTEALAEALADIDVEPPSTLAQFTLGEQVANAFAPDGGVICAPTDPGAVPGQQATAELSNSAGAAVPLSLGGAVVLLTGVALVVAAGRRPPEPPRPTPR